jgi:hypothetical protein
LGEQIKLEGGPIPVVLHHVRDLELGPEKCVNPVSCVALGSY